MPVAKTDGRAGKNWLSQETASTCLHATVYGSGIVWRVIIDERSQGRMHGWYPIDTLTFRGNNYVTSLFGGTILIPP